MVDVLSTPRNEFPEFPVGLSFIPLVTPESAHELLTARRQHLAQRLSEREALIASAGFPLPRATMLETGYLHATTEAEIRWLDSVLAGWTTAQSPGVREKCGKPPPSSTYDAMSLRSCESLDHCRKAN